MARKNYSDEFRRQAVDLYESTPGATLKGIADDLGISRGTLADWVDDVRHGYDDATAHDRSAASPRSGPGAGGPETAEREGRPARGRGRRSWGREGEDRDRAGDPAPGGQVFRRGDELVSRFQFVADHPDTFEVKRLCEVIEVDRSSFYAWDAAAPARAARAAADARAGRADPGGARPSRQAPTARRGSPPSSTTASRPSERVNHKRVARVMREHGIAGIRLRRRVRTTVPEPSDQKVPDLLKRDFTAAAPNQQLRRRHHLPAAGRRHATSTWPP